MLPSYLIENIEWGMGFLKNSNGTRFYSMLPVRDVLLPQDTPRVKMKTWEKNVCVSGNQKRVNGRDHTKGNTL